ncbi:helix-turn-helix transcriptional regulator [Streptococcus uberis]|uniref:helix-turn-helix transcriptional regulator n=1 Tax=Streptococcus uberis TaxID=1349 RepID=UPI0012B604FC|nr:helix-turn-helix domain-containing protein [Streptococcus uberis]ELY5748096.1 helix-turn-helix domain-containing protein [Streptococcus iniae]MCK1235471.1 helix-turn-helix domain-containing protein [Streptococcus uberis]MTB49243.1 helix-turn-helix domain-containing protein [Streptococcus uberis]
MSNQNKVRGYRTMLGLTQKEMADELGISKQSYYNKENGIVSFRDSEKIQIKNLVVQLFPSITIDEIFF